MRDRTADLLRARQALSQLSYSPNMVVIDSLKTLILLNLVGQGRLELPTSPLSGVRSNQLSYRPKSSLATVKYLFASSSNQLSYLTWWVWADLK